MCKYCEKRKEIKSCNYCGCAKAVIVGTEIEIHGDESIIRWFNRIYAPSFKINHCLMCGRKLSEES